MCVGPFSQQLWWRMRLPHLFQPNTKCFRRPFGEFSLTSWETRSTTLVPPWGLARPGCWERCWLTTEWTEPRRCAGDNVNLDKGSREHSCPVVIASYALCLFKGRPKLRVTWDCTSVSYFVFSFSHPQTCNHTYILESFSYTQGTINKTPKYLMKMEANQNIFSSSSILSHLF